MSMIARIKAGLPATEFIIVLCSLPMPETGHEQPQVRYPKPLACREVAAQIHGLARSHSMNAS